MQASPSHNPLSPVDPQCYGTYESVFRMSATWPQCTRYPGTALDEIRSQASVPMSMMVVGKPLLTGDAFEDPPLPRTLRSWAKLARVDFGWQSGFVTWQWSAVYGSGWVSGIDGVADPFPPPSESQTASRSFTSSATRSRYSQSTTQTPSPTLLLVASAEAPSPVVSPNAVAGITLGTIFGLLAVIILVSVLFWYMRRKESTLASKPTQMYFQTPPDGAPERRIHEFHAKTPDLVNTQSHAPVAAPQLVISMSARDQGHGHSVDDSLPDTVHHPPPVWHQQRFTSDTGASPTLPQSSPREITPVIASGRRTPRDRQQALGARLHSSRATLSQGDSLAPNGILYYDVAPGSARLDSSRMQSRRMESPGSISPQPNSGSFRSTNKSPRPGSALEAKTSLPLSARRAWSAREDLNAIPLSARQALSAREGIQSLPLSARQAESARGGTPPLPLSARRTGSSGLHVPHPVQHIGSARKGYVLPQPANSGTERHSDNVDGFKKPPIPRLFLQPVCLSPFDTNMTAQSNSTESTATIKLASDTSLSSSSQASLVLLH